MISPLLVFRFSTSNAVSSAVGSNHVKMWTMERVVAILNMPAILVPFLYTTPLTDAIFCTTLVVHFHWGKNIVRYYQNLKNSLRWGSKYISVFEWWKYDWLLNVWYSIMVAWILNWKNNLVQKLDHSNSLAQPFSGLELQKCFPNHVILTIQLTCLVFIWQ